MKEYLSYLNAGMQHSLLSLIQHIPWDGCFYPGALVHTFYCIFLLENLKSLHCCLDSWMNPEHVLNKTMGLQGVGLVTWLMDGDTSRVSHTVWLTQADQQLTQQIRCAGWHPAQTQTHCGPDTQVKYHTTNIMRWIQMKMCPVAPEGAESACKSVFVMTSLALSCLNSWLRPVQLAHRPLTPTTSVLFVWAEKQLLSHCAICAFIARWH